MSRVTRLDSNDLLRGFNIGSGEQSLQILFTGDLYPGGVNLDSMILGKNIWGGLANEMLAHQINLANLESPLTTRDQPIKKYGPNLSCDPRSIKGIKVANFNILSLANNHIMDQGCAGLQETIDTCQSQSIEIVGVGSNLDNAKKPLYKTVNEVSICFIAATEHEFSIAERNHPGANPFGVSELYYQIQEAKRNSDVIILILHVGNEHSKFPSPKLTNDLRFLADAGASLIVCHHSHVSSGFEIHNGTPIFYSLGNFLFSYRAEYKKGDWFYSYAVSAGISKSGICNIRLIPVRQKRTKPGLELMNNEEAVKFCNDILDISEIILSPDILEKKWVEFCDLNKTTYIATAFNLNFFERQLLKFRFPVFWKIDEKSWLRFQNHIECESHLNALQTVIKRGFR